MKRAIICAALALVVVSLFQTAIPARLRAEEYEKLYELLEDIEGWEGKDPEGEAITMSGIYMLLATRSYSKGENEINAMIKIGNAAALGAFFAQHELNFETPEGKASTTEIDSFTVYTMYDKKKRSGEITVVLLPDEKRGAIFVLSFKDFTDEKGLELAKEFDWKKMKKMVESVD